MTALSISIWVYLCSWVIIDLLSSHTTWCCCIAGPSCARILERPVFVDPSIISLVCLLGLKYTISGALHRIFLTVVKAGSHSSDHVNLAFFMVRARRGAVLLENSGMKYAQKFAIPKNDLASVVVVGLVELSKAVVHSWVGETPCAAKITPKNLICGMPKMHFWRFSVSLQAWRCCRTLVSAKLCSLPVFPCMSMSSYMFLALGISASVWWISLWNTSAAALIPNISMTVAVLCASRCWWVLRLVQVPFACSHVSCLIWWSTRRC